MIRIQTEIEILNNEKNFTKPALFDVNSYLSNSLINDQREAVINIREYKVNNLRSKGEIIESKDGWDTLKITFDDLTEFARELLWYGDDLYVLSPEDLRNQVIDSLKLVLNG